MKLKPVEHMQTIHYNVPEIMNRESKTRISNALDKVDGVQEVCIDIVRRTVEVEYNSPATPDMIKDCITKAGYKID